jgi:hypothetical protein
VVLATLIVITWGTNLFHFATYDATYSHGYSFALVTALLYVVPLWYQSPTFGRSIALGAIGGLIVLTRHSNAIFLLYVVLYDVGVGTSVADRLRLWWERRRAIIGVAAVAAIVFAPQLAVYKLVTGMWYASPYQLLDIEFFFANPRLAGVLFSTQKGLFFWSPVLLLGRLKAYVLPSMLVLVTHAYLIASWRDWQLGGSYGHRGFTDALAIFALLVGASFAWIAGKPRAVRLTAAALVSAAVALSTTQMLQYWMGIIPFQDTTWEQYRGFFLRF